MRLFSDYALLLSLLPVEAVFIFIHNAYYSTYFTIYAEGLFFLGVFLIVHTITFHSQNTSLHKIIRATIFPFIVSLVSLAACIVQLLLGIIISGEYSAIVGVVVGSVFSAYTNDVMERIDKLSRRCRFIIGLGLILISIIVVYITDIIVKM